jgi:hypothetical protein
MQKNSAGPIWQTRGASIAAFTGLWLASTTGGSAFAQNLEVSPGGAIGLGNRGWSAAETDHAKLANELEFIARAGVASDYIYRGTTLSAHGPAARPPLKPPLVLYTSGPRWQRSICRPNRPPS